MWNGKRVSVILPTYNEKDSIRESIEEFLATGVVDEVIVVNNNATAGTSEEVARTAAREVIETRQGYGSAIQRGFREATGDYLVLSEPDGTFSGQDIFKLLAYAEDFDVVFGTRTTTSLIGEGANMGLFLKWGNWAVAKMMEFLFDTTHLSDVGCTMRLIKRGALDRIAPHFTVLGSHFGPEMMLLVIREGLSYIEVPVHYRARVGESSVTGNHWKAFQLGIRMILFILEHRFGGTPGVRSETVLRLVAQAGLYLTAALVMGGGITALGLLVLGRTDPPPIFAIPSRLLQLGLLVSLVAVGMGVVLTLRLAARRVVRLPVERLPAPEPVLRRSLFDGATVAMGGLILLGSWLGGGFASAPWSAVTIGLLTAVLAVEVSSLLVAVIAGVLAAGLLWPMIGTTGGLPALAALVVLLAALRLERHQSWLEWAVVIWCAAAAATADLVAAIGGVTAAGAIGLGRPALRSGGSVRRLALPVAALLAAIIVAPRLVVAAPPSAGSLDAAILGLAGRAVAYWMSAGPLGLIVGLVGLATLLYGWKERRSGPLGLAAVVMASAGILVGRPPSTDIVLVLPALTIGAVIAVNQSLRRGQARRRSHSLLLE